MENQNKTLLDMLKEGYQLYGDGFNFWLMTKHGYSVNYKVTREEVYSLRNKGLIKRVGGASKDYYKLIE